MQIAVIHSGLSGRSSYGQAATGVPPEDVGQALAEALPAWRRSSSVTATGSSSETVAGVVSRRPAAGPRRSRWCRWWRSGRAAGGGRWSDRRPRFRPRACPRTRRSWRNEPTTGRSRYMAIGYTPDAWSAASAGLRRRDPDLLQRGAAGRRARTFSVGLQHPSPRAGARYRAARPRCMPTTTPQRRRSASPDGSSASTWSTREDAHRTTARGRVADAGGTPTSKSTRSPDTTTTSWRASTT